MPGGQRHHRRLKSGPERRPANLDRQPGAGPSATAPAAQPMGAMLGHDPADRRQLAHLPATEPPRPALPIIKPTSATATRLRVVIDDLIHPVLRLEIAPRARMPGLPTRLAPLPLSAQQLLRFRARLRPPLRPRLGRIGQRRPRARTRVLAHPLLQTPQPLPMLLDPPRQLKNELNTRLTPRVKNRLRLGTIHARKIRCNKQESSPLAPTTERLPVWREFGSTRPGAVRARHARRA